VNKFGIEFWKYKADDKTPMHGKMIYDVQEFVRAHIINNFKKDCDHGQELGAAYVVFHVSNVNTYEIFSYNFTNIDRTIIDASIEMINRILDGSSYSFEFLFENLWWNGLNFLNPRDTVHLFENINYKNKGFMLDTGHLMNSNLDLNSGEDALEYLHDVIKRYDGIFDIKKHIRGVHLHQSLSGQYVKEFTKIDPFESTGDLELGYYEKFALLYDYVMNIDTHSPMVFDGTLEFINSISPEYLVFEITKSNRSELEPLLALQNTIFDTRERVTIV